LTLSELVAHTGLPKTTVHRMAIELVGLGALERRNGGYALGQRLFELGQLVPRHRALRDLARPYMQDLYEATRETVQVPVPDGFDVLYVEIIHGHRRVHTPAARGGRMPFHCTGLGKAVMAFSPPDTVARARPAAGRAHTPHDHRPRDPERRARPRAQGRHRLRTRRVRAGPGLRGRTDHAG
jgi:DNA-binding IclR family transcriptional regulator